MANLPQSALSGPDHLPKGGKHYYGGKTKPRSLAGRRADCTSATACFSGRCCCVAHEIGNPGYRISSLAQNLRLETDNPAFSTPRPDSAANPAHLEYSAALMNFRPLRQIHRSRQSHTKTGTNLRRLRGRSPYNLFIVIDTGAGHFVTSTPVRQNVSFWEMNERLVQVVCKPAGQRPWTARQMARSCG